MDVTLIPTINADVSHDGNLIGVLTRLHYVAGTITPVGGATDDGNGNVSTGIDAVDEGFGIVVLAGVTATENDGIIVIHGEMGHRKEITASLSFESGIEGSLSQPHTLCAEVVIGSSDYPVYDGPYDFTPSTEVQTINVSHTLPRWDITIQPIPSNYGLITWNGSTLTVS